MDTTDFDDVVQDAIREGWTLKSQYGDTVVLTKRRGLRPTEHISYAVGMLLVFGFGLAFPIAFIGLLVLPAFWVYAMVKRVTLTVSVGDDGEVEQTFR